MVVPPGSLAQKTAPSAVSIIAFVAPPREHGERRDDRRSQRFQITLVQPCRCRPSAVINLTMALERYSTGAKRSTDLRTW
jgi:hypothetical protein